MNALRNLLLIAIILTSQLVGEVSEQILSYLPKGAEVTNNEIVFTRNFQHQSLHYRLCNEAEEAYAEGGEALTEMQAFFESLDNFPFRYKDKFEFSNAIGKLNLTRELELLKGNKRQLKLRVDRLNYSVDGLNWKAGDISNMSHYGFGLDIGYYFTHVVAYFCQPVTFLVYDEANNNELVGMMWAFPSKNIAIQDHGIQTAWYLNTICCLPELASMGIGSTLIRALHNDPDIVYTFLDVADDNPVAIDFYTHLGFIPTSIDGTEDEDDEPIKMIRMSCAFDENGPFPYHVIR